MDLRSVNFEWLADLEKSQCFTTCEVSNPAKSSDFGADGYTASVTDWHELLQLTAPDDTCGIIYVRGNFPDTPDSILARTQRRDHAGNKGTFGAKLLPPTKETDLELGERLAQGWVNLRWPYTKYELRPTDDEPTMSSGTCEEISFVREGVLVQVVRLKWGHESSLSDYDSGENIEQRTVKFQVGGLVRFGCPCSNRGGPFDSDTFSLSCNSRGGLECVSSRYQKKLEMNLFVDGNQIDVSAPLHGLHSEDVTGTEVDIASIRELELSAGEPIIIVSTYALKPHVDQGTQMGVSIFANLEDHLGTCNTSVNMTDRLWTALCSPNYEANEAIDTCVIGRCVEQIIGVCSVPTLPRSAQGIDDPQPYLDGRNITQKEDGSSPIRDIEEVALLRNIITPQYVDVQSSFYQIRLLVKVYAFINSRHLEPDLLDLFQSLDNIKTAYLSKVRRLIESTLVWLVRSDLRPRRLLFALRSDAPPADVETQPSMRLIRCEQNRVKMNADQSYNQACYATLAVWYVIAKCPEAAPADFQRLVLRPQLKQAFDAVQKRASRDKEPTPKNDVLQWLHISCLLLTCNEQFIAENSYKSMDGFDSSGLDRQEVIRTQQRFEKYVTRFKTNQADSYSVDQEQLDRLLLLGQELCLNAIPTQFTSSLATSRANQARQRIYERKRTTRFNPGPTTWKGARVTSNGPWELLCTNHQSFLRIADVADVKAARQRLFEFLLADYSFMASWDRSDVNMVGKWWDIEPASVICATLLDLKTEGKLKSAMSELDANQLEESNPNIQQYSPRDPRRNTVAVPEEPAPEASIREILLQMKQIQEESSRAHLLQMQQLLVQEDISSMSKNFDWVACKPAPVFHPDWWVQSLQDTPEVYRAKQSRDVPLRKDIRNYLASRRRLDLILGPEYTTESVRTQIPATEVQFLSMFDIHMTKSFDFKTKTLTLSSVTNPILPGRESDGPGEAIRSPRLIAVKRPTDSYSFDQLETYRSTLFSRLNDSLVDIGAKHRILFAEKCTPSLVGAFIYVWHPDGLDAFDSYFNSISRFTETREAMWTTSITVSHWSIRPVSLSRAHIEMFKENRNNGEFPPASIAKLVFGTRRRMKRGFAHATDTVEERCSSLVSTGDPAGNFWVCSMWSSLTDAESISAPINSLPKVLQRFINQQASGRCLVFLILLGHLCEKLAAEYEMILSRLDLIVGLGDKVLLEGLEWGTSEAVDKLKKMLWGLEALRVFDDRLSASLSQIQKAQEAMERIVKQEAGQQHVDLLQEFNNVIEEFEKRYGMLSDVQIRTELKIRQVTGLRDGISTVTNVEDSQTALRDSKTTIKQGNNIRILTYITIAYLPMGLITGLFSIEHASFMDNVGNNGFAILTVVFILGTYALALSLESIIDYWARLRKAKKRRSSKPIGNVDAISGDDVEEIAIGTAATESYFGFRRRKGFEEGSLESGEKSSGAA